jgi:addiction module HigA family antidote
MSDAASWTPTWTVAPGEVLSEVLSERGMSQAELARRMDRPFKTISEIATGKAAVTPDTAIQLERTLGITAALWLGLESRYREGLARERDRAELESTTDWVQRFPLAELRRRGVLPRRASSADLAAQLLAFFAVSSPSGWEQHWGQLANGYRMSERLRVSRYAVAVWLREAERAAEGRELTRFAPADMRGLVTKLRALTREAVPAGAIAEASGILESVGIGIVLVDGVPGAPASGAVHWIRGNPWIILTLRHRTDDQFWFSLFHELGHLVDLGKGNGVTEELADGPLNFAGEQAANEFARDSLLPREAFEQWVESASINQREIVKFAAAQGVGPGILVGRLQRDQRVGPAEFNYLKRPLG